MFKLILVSSLGLMLMGCGQTGHLYLPSQQATPTQHTGHSSS